MGSVGSGPEPVLIERMASYGSRISAVVDGHEVWFESVEAQLVPATEVFASAMLVAAAAAGRGLHLDGAVTRRWHRGTKEILATVERWWGWSAPAPRASRRRRTRTGQGVGVCFSGGADSFHALRFSVPAPDLMVSVLGYDVALDDTVRCESMVDDVRAVAEATGTRAVVVTTNLLDHPLHQATDWGRTHGGPLAALGHALAPSIGSLSIASSNPLAHPKPWGSHWDLDRHWSSDVTIEHVGAQLWRAEKLAALVDDRVAQRHLRVCWEHRSEAVNCGWCEKCLRTSCDLLVAGGLERFERLPQREVLAERIDALESARGSRIVFERLLVHDLPSDLERAIAALVARSEVVDP